MYTYKSIFSFTEESQSDKLLENDIPESTEKLAIFNKHDSEEESAIPLGM